MAGKLSLRKKLLVLAAVNVFQPVVWRELLGALSPELDARELRAGVGALRREGLVRRSSGGGYVVTRRGRDTLPAGSVRKQRDVSRLLYLFERSRGGGAEA